MAQCSFLGHPYAQALLLSVYSRAFNFKKFDTKKETHAYEQMEIMTINGVEKLKMLTKKRNVKAIAGVSVRCKLTDPSLSNSCSPQDLHLYIFVCLGFSNSNGKLVLHLGQCILLSPSLIYC